MPKCTLWKRMEFDLIALDECYVFGFYSHPHLSVQPVPMNNGEYLHPGDIVVKLGGKKTSAGFTRIDFYDGAGLLVSSKNCKRLYTKKKAPVRNVEIPNSILIYILMSRTRIVADMFKTRPRRAIWEDRLKQIKKNKNVGHAIAYKIKNRVDKEVADIKRENEKLRQENIKAQAIKKALNEMGIDMDQVVSGYSNFVRKDRLKELITGIPYNLVEYLKGAETNLSYVNNILEKAMTETQHATIQNDPGKTGISKNKILPG